MAPPRSLADGMSWYGAMVGSLKAADTTKRPFTVREYHRMADAGILRSDDRTELIDGEIFRMSPIGVPHASCVDRLTALMTRTLGNRAIVRVQNPIVIGRHS